MFNFKVCSNFDTMGSRSDIRGKFWNVVLEKGWRRSVGPIMWEMKKCCLESRGRGAGNNILQTIKRRRPVCACACTQYTPKRRSPKTKQLLQVAEYMLIPTYQILFYLYYFYLYYSMLFYNWISHFTFCVLIYYNNHVN